MMAVWCLIRGVIWGVFLHIKKTIFCLIKINKCVWVLCVCVGHFDFLGGCLMFEFSPPWHFDLICNPLEPFISSLGCCIWCKHLCIFEFTFSLKDIPNSWNWIPIKRNPNECSDSMQTTSNFSRGKISLETRMMW